MGKLTIVLAFVGLATAMASAGGERQRGVSEAQTGVPHDPSAVGYLNLHKRHPDGDDGPAEFVRLYTSDHALQRLAQMEAFLKSFRMLTKRAERFMSRSELRAIGNTGADMQSIGFHNIPLAVEGTLLKQDYQLRQAQYELAQLKRSRGEISASELEKAAASYQAATRRMQLFWDTKLPTD